MGFTLHVGMHKRRISYVTAVEPLNYLGVAFAIVGVIAALRLFDASTFSELSNAQHGRAISNRVSLDNDFHLLCGTTPFIVLPSVCCIALPYKGTHIHLDRHCCVPPVRQRTHPSAASVAAS